MYKTGDFGYMKQGILYYEGRRDTQIKVRGHRVDISEIEKFVNQLDYVLKSAVLVYQAMQTDQALITFISTKKVNGKSIEKVPADVEKDLKTKLVDYMVPQVLIIEEFPYLSNGKVDRQTLLKMYAKIAGDTKQPDMVIDLENVPKDKLEMAKQVFEIIGSALGNELRSKISTDANFFELGGNSMNSVYTVTRLHDKGFHIGITDFLKAKNLGEVLEKVTESKKTKAGDMHIVADMTLTCEPLDELQQNQCIELLSTCFYKKADLDQFLPNLKLEHYYEALVPLWSVAIKSGLSFMVKTEKGELVGVALNFDVENEPEVNIKNPLEATFEFLEAIEGPIMQVNNL